MKKSALYETHPTLAYLLKCKQIHYYEYLIREKIHNPEFDIQSKFKKTESIHNFQYILSKWVPFHIETNCVFDMVYSIEDWLRVKNIYINTHKSIDLKDFKLATYNGTNDTPRLCFGTRGEHTGEYTLYDFANDLNLSL